MDALTLRSISGWASAKRPSLWTSHFAAKLGEVLTVSAPAALALQQSLGSVADAVERIAHHHEIGAASLGDHQALPFAVEQLQSELGLERLHLMADRALR